MLYLRHQANKARCNDESYDSDPHNEPETTDDPRSSGLWLTFPSPMLVGIANPLFTHWIS